MINNTDKGDDFVLSTNETHSVREFVERAFACVGVTIRWEGPSGSVEEVGVDSSSGVVRVRIDPKYFRPTEVDILIGDYTKARTVLGWEPKITFSSLVEEMVAADVQDVGNGSHGNF
jgi:GDPmannose 4,6-dehydratase